MHALAMNPTHPTHESSGGRLVAADGKTLPLKSAALRADARGGLARSTLIQRFANPHSEPLAVTYTLPLPADGAVSGFAFEVAGKRIVGEIDRKAVARERFERAIVEGRTAAILDHERSSIFTQELGNVPPGAEVLCEIVVDHPLVWRVEGCWEWRFPTVVAPRYLGAAGRVPDAPRITVDVADAPLPILATFSLRIRDRFVGSARPESPSHRIVARDGDVDTTVELSDEKGAALDRDVVVRWAVALPKVGVGLDVARLATGKHGDAAFGLVTIVPPSPANALPKVPRDLIVLLDTSGSMSGEPLDQARRVVLALVDTLDDADSLEMIEFSSAPRRWKRGAVKASAKARKEALDWLARLSAGGGTEMRSGILEALSPLSRESQRQVVLVTDGLIGSETEVVGTLLDKLPPGVRFHTVGVGSGVNRSLTSPAARAGRGLEVIIGIGEDPERAAAALVARTATPQVVDLQISGSAVEESAPERAPDLFTGAPTRISVRLKADGGELIARGRTANGEWVERIQVPPTAAASGNGALPALFAREQVEDLEARVAAGGEAKELDARIERLGIDFQISTRLTSWVAVTKDVTVDPQAPTRHERVPQMLPYGMSVEGLGLRGGMPPPMAAPAGMFHAASAAAPMKKEKAAFGMTRQRLTLAGKGGGAPPAPPKSPARDMKDDLSASLDELGEQEEEAPADLSKLIAPREPIAKPAPRRTLAGKRLHLQKGHWVFTFQLDAAAAWDPSQRVTVQFADGSGAQVEIDATQSTRGGMLEAGIVVRVAVHVSGAVEPSELELRVGGETMVVRLA
jgi:Ca-activated chloride channel family protein